MLGDELARLLHQGGAVDALSRHLVDPALHHRLQQFAEGIGLGLGQHDVLVAGVDSQLDAEIVGGAPDIADLAPPLRTGGVRSEEHTSELQSLMRISYAVFCLKKKKH